MGTIAITPLYVGLLGILLVILSDRVVIVVRGGAKISLGDGGNANMTPVIRAQGNFIEYVPLALILIGLAEFNGTSSTWVHLLGGALLVARILHPVGLSADFGIRATRAIGAGVTWLVIVAGAVLCIGHYIGAMP